MEASFQCSRQFALSRDGPVRLLALRRHNLILVLADKDDVGGFIAKVLHCEAQFEPDGRGRHRTYLVWQGVRITFSLPEWKALQAFVASELVPESH
jgi:hypothetical protein